MRNLYDNLCSALHAQGDGKGRDHADCPFCGAAGVKGRRAAYHFYLFDFGRGSGYVCWACGAKGTLRELAQHLRVEGVEAPRPPRIEQPTPTPPWAGDEALDRYTAWAMDAERHRQIVAAWQAYKPLTADTIRRERLAVGRMSLYDDDRGGWYAMRHPRLLVPLIVGPRIVGFRGRAYERGDTGAKWLTASHSQQALMGLDRVREGDTVVWCENLIDRLLLEQDEPSVVAVASGGLAWQASWLRSLAKRRPSRVVIWFDHDLAGNGGGDDRAAFVEAWQAEVAERRREKRISATVAMPQPPVARGPRLVDELRDEGITAELYQWPRGTPRKADVGWWLEQH